MYQFVHQICPELDTGIVAIGVRQEDGIAIIRHATLPKYTWGEVNCHHYGAGHRDHGVGTGIGLFRYHSDLVNVAGSRRLRIIAQAQMGRSGF